MDIRTLPARAAAALSLEAVYSAKYSIAASDALLDLYKQMTASEMYAYLDVLRIVHAFREWARRERCARLAREVA